MIQKIRIAIIDDHPLFREGVINSLALESDMDVVGEGATAHDAIRLAGHVSPDVIVLDVNMEGNVMKAVETITSSHPNVNIMMLTMVANEDCMAKAMTMGARGYVLKGVSSHDLCGIVRKISRRERFISPGMVMKETIQSHQWQDTIRFCDLSEREQQILALVSQALSNKEIAWRVKVTEKTVKHYVTSILKKLNARNRVEAALMASHHTAPSKTEQSIKD